MSEYVLRPPECQNLAPATDAELGRGHISHSSLNTFLACEQRFEYQYEERLEPAVRAQPLQMGGAFAKALEAGSPELARHLIEDEAAQQVVRAAESLWVTAPSREQVEIDATIVESAARAYLIRYGPQPGRELEMRVRVRNPKAGGKYSLTHDLVCRVDALDVESKTLIEDKLSGAVQRGTLPQRIKLDRQVSIGAYCAWRCFGVTDLDVRYRVTLKPQIRRRQNESHDEYVARIAADYVGRPDHYLIEEPAVRVAEDFLRLERELWRWTERLREARRDGTWARNTDSCVQFGGCRFLSLCTREPGAAEQFVTKEYDERKVA